MNRSILLTEQRLPESMELDAMSLDQAIEVMNAQNARAVAAVAQQKDAIRQAIEIIVPALRAGGRLFYVGAGTSGRLGILDAAEIPPTFRASPDLFQGIIAGGQDAVFRSIEGAEDQID